MVKAVNLFWHKWRDRGYPSCPKCRKQIKQCPYCKGDTLLPKATTYPDFLVTRFYAFVEVKQAKDSYNLYDLSDNQEKVLNGTLNTFGSGWVYVEFTEPSQAYLIPWHVYKDKRDKVGLMGFKSIRSVQSPRSRAPLAEDIFKGYALEWEEGRWNIPKMHIWNYVKL